MQIRVLRKMKYQNRNVYIMNFDYCFQYLFSHGSDIYQNHIFITPPIWTRILYRLGLIKNLYTRETLEEGEKIILSGAMKTIDELNDPVAQAKRRKDIREAKAQNEARIAQIERTECIWQARESKDDMFYLCLTHNIAVKMEEGVKPKHQ